MTQLPPAQVTACPGCGRLVMHLYVTAAGSPFDATCPPEVIDPPVPVTVDRTPQLAGRYWRTDVAVAACMDLSPSTSPAAFVEHLCAGRQP